ncbi:DUF418 domain-containing protein [Novosphingobium resinovorum]|uniref:DUF418 domain-containing protein n=2 Tax=Novosphingobium TaxID=165696 RepID=A0A1D8A0I7_9SPHN|nr:DUF418 domain-containing protein [Novosphingobium resinovorum]AOR75619.1 hypothetical protein BES08_01735 [Novosphingobium resinovorum]MBF7010946.1 DUF418 domain-containing protein [Novosphingobium sp. HR1a]WJM28941.1 DUF418 domain-containing protein [Novosphingobium resinovorum]
MAGEVAEFGPVRGRARIDVIDVMRGIAILGILYMNIPFMGTNVSSWMHDFRRLSWSAADQTTWATIQIFWEGTQRGLFELLFGAGVLVFTAKAMKPDDPVAVADLYYRRNLLLVLFGLTDIFVIGWVGDILLAYGLCALLLFPFRKTPPKVLLAMGMAFAALMAVGWPGGGGVIGYQERVERIHKVEALQKKRAEGVKLSGEDKKTLDKWQEKVDAHDLSKPPSKEAQVAIDAERKARAGWPHQYVMFAWFIWNKVFGDGNGLFFTMLEAVPAMCLGMALFKWGVIQGGRSMGFYAGLAIVAYGVGCGLRAWDVAEIYKFTPWPTPGTIAGEFARLAVTVGHVGLFNLLMKTQAGRTVLSPFKAAGRMAFSIYILTSIVTLWFVFAPWGLGLWGKFGWTELAIAATVIDVVMLVLANVWLRFFLSGPLEWIWRSLTYWKRQPFLRPQVSEPSATAAFA